MTIFCNCTLMHDFVDLYIFLYHWRCMFRCILMWFLDQIIKTYGVYNTRAYSPPLGWYFWISTINIWEWLFSHGLTTKLYSQALNFCQSYGWEICISFIKRENEHIFICLKTILKTFYKISFAFFYITFLCFYFPNV